MTWTYSGDPGDSAKDEVRFYVQDTDEEFQLISDEEIEYLLDRWTSIYGSVIYTASVAAEMIAAKFTGETSISADGVSVDITRLSERYQQLAGRLRTLYQEHGIGGQIDVSNLLWGFEPDPTIKALMFGIGLHDNLEAGQQEFGGINRFAGPATAQIAYLREHAGDAAP